MIDAPASCQRRSTMNALDATTGPQTMTACTREPMHNREFHVWRVVEDIGVDAVLSWSS